MRKGGLFRRDPRLYKYLLYVCRRAFFLFSAFKARNSPHSMIPAAYWGVNMNPRTERIQGSPSLFWRMLCCSLSYEKLIDLYTTFPGSQRERNRTGAKYMESTLHLKNVLTACFGPSTVTTFVIYVCTFLWRMENGEAPVQLIVYGGAAAPYEDHGSVGCGDLT